MWLFLNLICYILSYQDSTHSVPSCKGFFIHFTARTPPTMWKIGSSSEYPPVFL